MHINVSKYKQCEESLCKALLMNMNTFVTRFVTTRETLNKKHLIIILYRYVINTYP